MQSRHSNSHSPDEATGLPQTAPEAEVHCPSSWQLAQGPLENHVMLILLEHVCASVSLKLKKYARHQETTGELNMKRDAKFYIKLAAHGKTNVGQ